MWLDVCAHFPGQVQLWRLDVTVRSSWAQGAQAPSCPGAAAAAGVSAKQRRYGDSVAAISMEPLGRMAKESCEALWEIARQARHQCITPVAPSEGYRSLRLGLERALLWSMAERLVAATGRGGAD